MRKITMTAAALLATSSLAANATIIGGSLLDNAGANHLETWLGVGDQDFTNIWTGTAGVSTSYDFHNAVDGQGPTISIYGITLADGSTARVGGYTSLSWGGYGGYRTDNTAFIFNLDTLEVQTPQYGHYAIYRYSNYFPTFGGGHDLFGGAYILGTYYGNPNQTYDGYSYSHSYDHTQGQITVAGDSGWGHGNSGTPYWSWRVNSLEVYTHTDAVGVAEPGTLALLGLGFAGMGLARRRAIV